VIVSAISKQNPLLSILEQYRGQVVLIRLCCNGYTITASGTFPVLFL